MLPFWDEVSRRFYVLVGAARGARLLDVGSGPGTLVRLARNDGIEAFGVEPNWRGAELSYVMQGRAEALPFPGASFDVLTCFSVIEYIEDPQRALSEVARVLRDGGKAVFAVPELAATRGLRRDRYRTITSEGWFRDLLATVPRLRARSVSGFGLRYLVPIAKRTIVRALPSAAPRPLATIYARGYPRAISDLTIWTLTR